MLNFRNTVFLFLDFQSDFEPATFVMDFLGILCSLMWPSIFCYFADLTTDRVLKIGDTVYDLNWFDQPVEMQKYVTLMIARSQERIYFSGLGLITCSLEAFGKVCICFDWSKTQHNTSLAFCASTFSYFIYSFWIRLAHSMWFFDAYHKFKINSNFIYV